MVFAIHFYAFWMIAFCVVGPALGVLIVVFMKVSGLQLASSTMDGAMTYALTSCCAAYVFVAAGRVPKTRNQRMPPGGDGLHNG